MKIHIIILLIGLVSCKPNKPKESIEDYRHIKGKIIENLGDTIQFIDAVDYDSISGHIYSKGKFYRDLRNNHFARNGWHSFYNDENLLTQKIKYYNTVENDMVVDNITQIINYSSKGDTIKETSIFFELKTNFDSISKLNDTLKFRLEINPAPQTMKMHGKYNLSITNSFEDNEYNIKSTQPYFSYKYCPQKSGKLNIQGEIFYYGAYGQEEDVDSLLPITMYFNKQIEIIE